MRKSKRQSLEVSGAHGEAGQVLVLAAASLTVLMLAAGLAIDMGYLRYQRRRMQTAADSAAIAAATQLGGDWQDAATTDASLNGFSSSNNATVTPSAVNCPDGTASCVQVQVSQPQQIFFMKILGNNLSPVVSTTATAEQVPGLGCAYALSNANDAVTVGYGYHTQVVGSTCAFDDNGGLEIENSASHSVLAESVAIGGTYNGGGNVIPAPVVTSTGSGDPFASLLVPSAPPGCTGQSTAYVPGAFSYPCGLTINPPTGTSLTLNPGLYTVGGPAGGGGGLTIGAVGGGGTVIGTGVSFYVSGTAAININSTGTDEGTYNYGTTVELQAPVDASSGGIAGVVLFQDRSDTQPANIALGGYPAADNIPASYLWGAVYAPSATLTLTGMGFENSDSTIDECSSTPRFTTVVALKLAFHENINFSTDDCQVPFAAVSTPVSSPNRNAVLVK